MRGLMNALAPVDAAAARNRGTQNALAEMKARSTANTLNRNQAIRDTGQQAAQGGYSTEEHANSLRKMGHTDAANKLVQQGQQTRGQELGNAAKGYEIVARTAPLARDQRSYDRIKQFWEEKGLAQAGELPDEFDPELVRTLAGKSREKLSASDLVEVQGPDGRPRFVPADMAAGMSPAQDQADFDQVNVALPGGERVRGRKGPGGSLQVLGDQGQWVEAPRGAQRVGVSLSGSEEDVGLGDTEARNLNNSEVAARELVSTTADAIEMLDENPDINTFTGRAASLVNDFQQEGKALARGLGLEFNEEDLEPSKYSESFDRLGIENARMRSLVTSLAFQAAAATGQTGRAVSDRDIQRFVEEVGASSSDPRAFKATLRDVAGRAASRFETSYGVRKNRPYEGNLGLDKLEEAQTQEFTPDNPASPASDEEYEELPSGSVFRDPESGELLRKP